MDTLTNAKENAKRMIDEWNPSPTTLDSIIEEIRDEFMRIFGDVPPSEITPEQQGDIDDTLGMLGLDREGKK
jgi:hypothetical protein